MRKFLIQGSVMREALRWQPLFLLCLLTFVCWKSLLDNPLEEAMDYAAATGTLLSAEQRGSASDPMLDFYVEGSTICFRVPMGDYKRAFNRQAFFANVRPGAKITFQALKSQLNNPYLPPLNPSPIVFVFGLKDEQATYSIVEDHLRWQKNNRALGLRFAIVLSFITVAALVVTLVAIYKPEAFAAMQSATREENES